jgi:mannose-6-phosphate isomerase-like protein (cupin superfamily)
MKIFPRKEKKTPGAFYFGEFNETPLAPFSVSIATFDSSFSGEPKHYHKDNQKVFITLNGKGVLNVNGEHIDLVPEQMIQIEPNDIHFLEKVVDGPLQIVVVLSSKINDKVVVD